MNTRLCKLKEGAEISGTRRSYVINKKVINVINCDMYIEQVIKEKRKENMKCNRISENVKIVHTACSVRQLRNGCSLMHFLVVYNSYWTCARSDYRVELKSTVTDTIYLYPL